jgi:hypothetical protein
MSVITDVRVRVTVRASRLRAADTDPMRARAADASVTPTRFTRIGVARRRGVALVFALVCATICGIAVLALWKAVAEQQRTGHLDRSVRRAAAIAESAQVRALFAIDSGHWRNISAPGASQQVMQLQRAGERRLALLGRTGWTTLLARGTGVARSGVSGVAATADRRLLIPLVSPIAFLDAAVTGGSPWLLHPGSTIDLPPASGDESVCRWGSVPRARDVQPWPAPFAPAALPLIDPDTVRDTIRGAVRLAGPVLARPIQVQGILALDSDLVVGADLHVSGVLIARGSVRSSGGQLTVTGAVVAGDAGGGHSELGAGDRVRYDGCAIRRALEQVTVPGPSATWTRLSFY